MRKRILCYGDSNTYGYIAGGMGRRYSSFIRWTCQLQTLLGDDYIIIDEGCSGRTAEADPPDEHFKNGTAYLDTSLHTHRPVDFVILMLGTNDLKTAYHKSAEMIASSIGRMIAEIHDYLLLKQGFAPQVLLMSPASLSMSVLSGDFSDTFGYDSVMNSKKLAKLYAKIAEKTGSLFLDIDPFTEVSSVDGVHLTEESHTALAHKLNRMIREYYSAHESMGNDDKAEPEELIRMIRRLNENADLKKDDLLPAEKLFDSLKKDDDLYLALRKEKEETDHILIQSFIETLLSEF